MSITATEVLEHVIDASEMLLELLDTSDLELEFSSPELSELPERVNKNSASTEKLLKLMMFREEKIHQLFNDFDKKELQTHQSKLQTIAKLDNQLVEKINQTQDIAKSEILTLKKNRKAINLYQKL